MFTLEPMSRAKYALPPLVSTWTEKLYGAVTEAYHIVEDVRYPRKKTADILENSTTSRLLIETNLYRDSCGRVDVCLVLTTMPSSPEGMWLEVTTPYELTT